MSLLVITVKTTDRAGADQGLVYGRGWGLSEILLTSHDVVEVAGKNWATKLGVRGKPAPPPHTDPHLKKYFMYIVVSVDLPVEQLAQQPGFEARSPWGSDTQTVAGQAVDKWCQALGVSGFINTRRHHPSSGFIREGHVVYTWWCGRSHSNRVTPKWQRFSRVT